MMTQAREIDEGIADSSTKAILHFKVSGPANLCHNLDQSSSNKQQEQGFSELWRVSH